HVVNIGLAWPGSIEKPHRFSPHVYLNIGVLPALMSNCLRLRSFRPARNLRENRPLPGFCYETGFANAKSIQFYALLARRNLGFDSAICSSWGFIQNPQNRLLTSGS